MSIALWKNHPHAPKAGVRLCQLEEIPDGSGKEFIFGPDKNQFKLVVFRLNKSAWGYINVCPHFWLPLNARPEKFLICGPGRVMCSFHSAIFRFEDGLCIDGPVKGGKLDSVPVEVKTDHSVIVGND